MLRRSRRACLILIALSAALFALAAPAQRPARGAPPERGSAGGPAGSILQRYQELLAQSKAAGLDTAEAESLAAQSAAAIRAQDRPKADALMRQAIDRLRKSLPSPDPGAGREPAATDPGRNETPVRRTAYSGPPQPVFLLAFTHHYNGPGGYYPAAAEVRTMGEFFVKAGIPGTLFFDGILVERLQKEDPDLIRQIRQWNLPIGYHGEETHGPYPVASELLGEVYTLREAQGYRGQWSLTTGQPWDSAVRLVEERYSFTRPYRIDEANHMLDRRAPSTTDRSRIGGLRLVQQAFGKDVSFMPSHGLESAPEGYAFRRMSRFGLDQPAVPVALHALKIFRIGDVADRVMAIAGANESIFWYMGRLHCKGDDDGEAGYHLGALRHSLDNLDRSRPRLLLVGFSKVDESAAMQTVRYLNERFFPDNPGSGWVTGDTLPDRMEPEKAYAPVAADLVALARGIVTNWQSRPPDLAAVNDRTLALTDAFEALLRGVAGTGDDGRLPASVPLHPLYGPVLEDSAALLRRPETIPLAQIRAAARTVAAQLDASSADRFVPARVVVGTLSLNAAEFLYALAATVTATNGAAITVPPSQVFPPYADLLQSVFKPKAVQPLCYTKGQLWTVKPARLRTSSGPAATPAAPPPPAATGTVSGVSAPLDGRLFAVFSANLDSQAGCQRDDPGGADLYRVTFDLRTRTASGLQRLTRREGPEWFPALSPDARFVAYDRTVTPAPGTPPRHDIWLIDLASGKEQALLERARFPAFDPAGRFVYYSPQLRGDHQIVRAELTRGTDGTPRPGRAEPLADRKAGSELVEDPSPFPDNSAVAFHRKESESGAGVAMIRADGTGLAGLTAFDGCGHAAVSPDGNAVACTRSRDGHVVIIRKTGSTWQAPRDLPLSSLASDYVNDDLRFGEVREVRHSYLEWVTPELLLCTSHGADGPKSFRFARLYLLRLKGDDQPPERIDLSAAIERLAGRKGRDFCTATAVIR